MLIVGLAGWIALVGAMTLGAMIWLAFSTITAPAWLGGSGPAGKASGARAAAGYENIVRRPLFSRNRQMLVAPEPVAPAPPPPMVTTLDPGMTLKGVFMNEGVAKAFLITAQSPLGTWVEVDGQIGGWRVTAVTPDHVVLEGQGEKLMVPLHASGK
jgi:hypothetical protein